MDEAVKFRLLMHYRWKSLFRSVAAILCVFVIPFLFILILALMRTFIPNEESPDYIYDPVKIEEVPNLKNVRGYCPENKINQNIMSSFPNAKPFKSRDEMEKYLRNFTEDVNIGVQFFHHSNASLDKNITIGLSFASGQKDWFLEQQFPRGGAGTKIIEPSSNVGGPPYYSEHFVPLMYTLTKKLIDTAGKGSKLPNIYIQRFPYAEFKENPIPKMKIYFFFLFAFICQSQYMVAYTHEETHKMIKKVMMIRGFRSWMIWTTLYVIMVTSLFVFSVISIAILYWNTQYGPIYEYSNVFLTFLWIFLNGMLYFAFGSFLAVICPSVLILQGVLSCFLMLSIASYELLDHFSKQNRAFSMFGIYATTFVGFDIFSSYEEKQQGVYWSNLAEKTNVDRLSLCSIYLIIICEIICFLFLAISLEAWVRRTGGFSVYKCRKLFKKVTPSDVPQLLEEADNQEFFENEPTGLNKGIEIVNVIKDYGPNHVLKNVSMNVYENQITVLLGHNGAGKTTLISIVTGLVAPTEGTAVIDGHDISKDRSKALDSLSICFQDDLLMDELTVHEHLVFFLVLKGTRRRSSEEDIDEVLHQLDLQHQAHKKVSQLSGGMKRKLSVAIALCGNTKVVMLDEPTAGLDPTARRKLWNFIEKEKIGRTILMTTHYMDEADVLGDRIAIMCHGRIICCGTSFFLKRKYGTGYHLIIDRTEDSNAKNITALIRQYIPGIETELMTGRELFYLMPSEYSTKFPKLLRDIENESAKLGIKTFGISLTDLEEVFMKVGSSGSIKKYKPTQEKTESTAGVVSAKSTGRKLLCSQSVAMLYKFLFYYNRNSMDLGFSIASSIVLILTMKNTKVDVDMPSMNFRLEDYDRPIALVEENEHLQESFVSSLRGRVEKIDTARNITGRILEMWKSSYFTMNYQYIFGTSFRSDATYAWFNGQAYHSLPLSVQLILQHNYKSIMGADYILEFTSMPLSKDSLDADIVYLNANANIMLIIVIFLAITFLLFHIRERGSGFKHLQFISGINLIVFHLSSIIVDILLFLVLLIIPIIFIYWKKPIGIETSEDLGILALICFCFCIYALALDSFLALFISSETWGYLLAVLALMVQAIICQFLEMLVLDSDSVYAWPLKIVFPIYACYDALAIHLRKRPCKGIIQDCMRVMELNEKTCQDMYCSRLKCCSATSRLNLDLLIMVVVGILFYVFIALIDFRIFTTCTYRICHQKKPPNPPGDEKEDEDVLNEADFIANNDIEKLRHEYAVVMKDLTKYYRKFLAVNRLNLTVQKAECFGLLGVNGAGKTTTFKMMTGLETMSQGDCWINGYSVKNQYNRVRKYTGYCPQFSACLPGLTARETLSIMFLIRGVVEDNEQLKKGIVDLARMFDFEEHLDKKIEDLSGGNKRKLCSTLATIGNPPIVFLDEPTTGLDAATKHFFWDAIHKIRATGTSIVLTSHSMEECEALCTRVAIMVKGKFKCLGSIQHLKSRFASGLLIIIKLRKQNMANTSSGGSADTSSVEHFMAETFPTAILKEKYNEYLRYEIEHTNMRWSEIFEIMEDAKIRLNIEDYAVEQPKLEQIFLKFAKMAEEEEQNNKNKRWCC